MAEQADLEAPAAVAAPDIAPEAPKEAIEKKESKDISETAEVAPESVAPKEEPVAPALKEEEKANTNGDTVPADDVTDDALPAPKPEAEDVEMKETTSAAEAVAPAPDADTAPLPVDASTPSATKGKGKRKSTGVPEHKGKKLNKKASKAKLGDDPKRYHPDAQPGDHFFIHLKGYPRWPGIVADNTMLPQSIIKSRPLGAQDEHGNWRPGYEEGGAKYNLRVFPVMYLETNEFSWTSHKDLETLTPEDVEDGPPKPRPHLAGAFVLAHEQHDLQHYKDILHNWQEEKMQEKERKDAAEQAAAAKKAAKKAKKPRISSANVVDDDDDVEMADVDGEVDSEEAATAPTPKTISKKRKIPDEESETPQRAESAKKAKPTKIKLTTNGSSSTPKSAAKDPASAKATKTKTKKAKVEAAEPEVVLTAEQKRAMKQKEILFLRHKLQKGLLTRDQEPKEEEMKQMSEFVTKLEGYSDLEVSIIRATKINKVLKAILKLTTIPKEEEFKFKQRSQSLLDKWNKLLASEQGTPAATAAPNGVSEGKSGGDDAKATPAEATNGVKEAANEPKVEEKVSTKALPATEAKEVTKEDSISVEEPAKEKIEEPAAVETTA